MPSAPITTRSVSADIILPLRHAILRAHRPIDIARFKEDNDPDTLHIAAFQNENVVGCATLIPRSLNHPLTQANQPAHALWQLRGMATAPNLARQGVGQAIIHTAIAALHTHHNIPDTPPLIWCNARIVAIDFYRKQGFQPLTGTFLEPDVGPHIKMFKLAVSQ